MILKSFFAAFVLILLNSIPTYAQKPAVIKITNLEKRLHNTNDTTYVVNFWATWCLPCIEELPVFEKLNILYTNQKVKVLLISMDFSEDLDKKLIPFIKKKHLIAEVMLLDEVNGNHFIPKISNKWTGAIPATLIINNKKKYKEFFEKKLDLKLLEETILLLNKQ